MRVSLSARRAWIEIPIVPVELTTLVSLSARRAWIEIFAPSENMEARRVSLSARRAWIEIRHTSHDYHASKCRSPQGERG